MRSNWPLSKGVQPRQRRETERLIPQSPRRINPAIPRELETIVLKAIRKAPQERYATAQELCDGLRGAAVAGPPASATLASSGHPAAVQTAAPPASRPSAADDSGAARAEQGFWVAVLPFKYTGASADLTVLAEGISEEIVTGLSRFSYLRVIARS